jgi:SHS2 domain-containing protein
MKAKICNLDHTADAGVKIFGNTLEEIFINAASAMYHILGCDGPYPAGFTKKMEIKEEGLEILLVTFLNELNYYLSVRRTLLTPIQILGIKKIKNNYVLSFQTGVVSLDPTVSEIMPEIKSVTYHNMNIQKKNNMYFTHVIFDL